MYQHKSIIECFKSGVPTDLYLKQINVSKTEAKNESKISLWKLCASNLLALSDIHNPFLNLNYSLISGQMNNWCIWTDFIFINNKGNNQNGKQITERCYTFVKWWVTICHSLEDNAKTYPEHVNQKFNQKYNLHGKFSSMTLEHKKYFIKTIEFYTTKNCRHTFIHSSY
jgi:hypothetical protein